MTEPSFALVPASYVYLLREGDAGTEVLLQLRGPVPYMADHWAAAAAGHVERGETAYDAAHREAQEELDITLTSLRLVTCMQRTQGADPIDERIDFFFTARAWAGEPRVVEAHKCRELRWCRLDDLPAPLVPHERTVLEGLAGAGAGLPPYLTHGFDPVPTGTPTPGGNR